MLALEELLIETDSDLSIVETVVIGFDDSGRLVLEHNHRNYDDPALSYTRRAIAEKEEAYVLAKRLNVSLVQLPADVFRRFGVQPFGQALPSEGRALFKAVLDFFVSQGVRCRLEGKR